MIVIDTNRLVRFLVRGDEAQFERARELIKHDMSRGEPAFISQLAPLATEWVPSSRYEDTKTEILAAISALLESLEVHFEDESAVEEAVFV